MADSPERFIVHDVLLPHLGGHIDEFAAFMGEPGPVTASLADSDPVLAFEPLGAAGQR